MHTHCVVEKDSIYCWCLWIRGLFGCLSNVDNLEVSLDEMRDVIRIDELFEGLFSAKI